MHTSPLTITNVSGRLLPRTRRQLWTRILVALALIVGFVTSYTGLRSAKAAFNPVAGTLISGAINTSLPSAGPSPTLPRGVLWLPDASVAGGHWWVGDQLLGLCRLDPVAINNSGAFALSLCDAAVKSGGQIVSGTVPGEPANMYLYVADTSAKSVTVLRYKILGVNTAAPTFGAKNPMKVNNITQVGGGTASGRPVALALYPSPTAALPLKQDLLVGYIKSGDVMRVSDVNEGANGAPTVTKIGSTSDGIGSNSFARVGNDLYIAEVGGLGGVSKIADPLGVTKPACTAASVCSAVSVSTTVGFPGGMAYDGSRFLYVGDVRTGGATNYVYRLDLTTSPVAAVVLSNSVAPFSAKDGNQLQTSYTSYTFPLALGYRPNGDLYVGGDPQLLAATVTNQQGHIWKIVTPPAPPTVTSLAPNNGSASGNTVVTITGTNFNTAPGATTVTFGAAAPVLAVCVVATSCTVTTPAGSGVVGVVVTTGGQTTDVTAASQFTYNVPVGPHVTSIAPTSGSANGGTVVTITGSGFTSTSSVSFVGAGNVVAGGLSTSCTNTSCTTTAPAGAGPTDVIVNDVVTNVSSDVVPADVFNFTPVITSLDVVSGSSAGGDLITVTGNGFTPTTQISFGVKAGVGVICNSVITCTVTTPAGVGTVDVKATVGNQTGVLANAFTYTAAAILGPQITAISPAAGSTAGGTVVTLTGVNFPLGAAAVAFNGLPATFVNCTSATSCTMDSPAGAAGVAAVNLTDVTQVPSISNSVSFTYVQATAGLYAWGITAPKGGAVWLPGSLGGHWWSSDHAQGFCRQDALNNGTGRFALDFSVCGDDLVGSAGQGVYDPRPVNTYDPTGTIVVSSFPSLHYVYVPDNAVKSVAVWRLTFNSATETMVPDPNGGAMATAMAAASDLRTLKPNGMALGPLDNAGVFCGLPTAACTPAQVASIGLYVTDLVEKYVRVIINPERDPNLQVVGLVAATGDGRGANGTAGFIGSNLYVSGNRATQFFDVTVCPSVGFTTPPASPACGMASVPSPVGVFVAGTATDPVRKLVYQSNSPGGAASAILRYDASHDVYVKFLDGTLGADLNGVVHCELNGNGCIVGPTAGSFLDGGTLPGPLGSPVIIATGPAGSGIGATRPWDSGNHPTLATKFGFAFGLGVGPSGELIITEDPSAGARSGRGTMWTVPFTG